LLALQWGGTNQTIANSSALKIVGGALSNVTNGYGLTVAAPSGAGSNYAAAFTGGNVGVGQLRALPVLLSVGSSSQFQVNSSGSIIAIGAVTHSITDSSGLTLTSANHTLNLQPDGDADVNIAGGYGATGCTIYNANGNLSCNGVLHGSNLDFAEYLPKMMSLLIYLPAL